MEGGQEGWLREWIREQHEKKTERLLAEWQSSFFSLYTCFSCPFSPALAGQAGWGGVEILLEKFHIRGLHVLAPWRGASLEAPALLPKLCSRSPAWLCCAPFKWIYGPINGESLCTIKSRTDLSGIQFNNYLSNSIIFRYVVSVSADLEDLLGAFDRQDSTLSCSVTNPALHSSHTPQNFRQIVEGLSESGRGEGCAEDLSLLFPLFEGCSSGQLWKTSASVLINDLFKHSSWKCLKPSSLAHRTLEVCRVSWWALKTGPL